MSISLRGLHPDVRAGAEFALDVARFNGITPRVTSAFRSWENQLRLFQNFRRCVDSGQFPSPPDCRFPANRPGDSAHQFGLAFDSVVESGDQPVWDAIRRWVGFGVPQNDRIHAEVPGWRRFV